MALETKQNSIEASIQSSIRRVVSRMFEDYIVKNNITSSQDVESLVLKSTEEMCLVGSAQMLAALSENNGDLIQRRILLKCVGEEDNRFKADPEWRWHAVGIIQSKDGKWYSFSPANIQTYKGDYGEIISADSLEELLDLIEEKEGGSWRISESEMSKATAEEGVPEFYELRLRKLLPMNDSDLLASVNSYNQAIESDGRGTKITTFEINRLIQHLSRK